MYQRETNWPTMYDWPIPTPEEREGQQRLEAEQRAESLAARLRALGIDPKQL
jgi:hypothetical protein